LIPYREFVGNRIKARRIELGFSKQGDLAKAIGTDRTRVSRWESGESLPDGIYKAKLLATLEMTEPELFDLPDNMGTADPPETVANMPVEQFTSLLANVSNKDTLELMRLKKKLESIPEEVLDSWREASTANKALCMFLLTGDGAYVDVLPLSAQSTLKTILRALGTKPP